MFKFNQYRLRRLDFWMIGIVIILAVLGMLILGSAMVNDVNRDSTLQKQVIGIVAGLAFMAFFALVDYHFLMKFGFVIYILMILILIGVLIPGIGVASHNARRWLSLGGLQIQPSEFAKIGVILFFAMFMSKCADIISRPLILLASIGLISAPIFLVLREPDLSTTIVIVVIFLAMLFAAGLSYKWILGGIAVAIPASIAWLSWLVNSGSSLIQNYQVKRVLSWLYPDQYAESGLTTQQDNSILAIASGQLQGKGLNTTSFESVKVGQFLSEENSDFVFAVIGEELGFIGSVIILILIAVLVFRCFRIAARARDMSGRLICTGYAVLLSFQTFVNVGVATGLLPNTGLPLPFFSAGVSSLFSLFLGLGVVLNVGLQCRDDARGWQEQPVRTAPYSRRRRKSPL